MVKITETDDSKVSSHHRYTGAVRVDFPRGEETVDVDEETARTAVNSYETVEFADELVEQHNESATATGTGEAGKKAETHPHQNAAGQRAESDESVNTRESRAPHADTETEDEEPTPGEAP